MLGRLRRNRLLNLVCGNMADQPLSRVPRGNRGRSPRLWDVVRRHSPIRGVRHGSQDAGSSGGFRCTGRTWPTPVPQWLGVVAKANMRADTDNSPAVDRIGVVQRCGGLVPASTITWWMASGTADVAGRSRVGICERRIHAGANEQRRDGHDPALHISSPLRIQSVSHARLETG